MNVDHPVKKYIYVDHIFMSTNSAAVTTESKSQFDFHTQIVLS